MSPVSAPMKPVIMKFPYLILGMLIPASLAPRMLPPTEIVCRPHRARLSTTWKTATRITVQVISAQVQEPRNLPTPAALAGICAG